MPSAHRSSQNAPAPVPNIPPSPRAKLIPSDVCVGCIVWLPKTSSHQIEAKCNGEHSNCSGKELEEAGYHHPVIVLKVRQRKNSAVSGDLICTIAGVTSFGDMSLSRYLEKRVHLVNSLPIHHPVELDQDLTVLEPHTELYLVKRRLQKQSYVRLDHVYDVPVSLLRTYGYHDCRAYKLRLAEPSYNIVMNKLGMPPEKYEITDTLFETAAARLLALAKLETPPTPIRADPPSPAPSSSRLVFTPVAQAQAQAQAQSRPHHPRPVEPQVVVQVQNQPREYSVYTNAPLLYTAPVSSGYRGSATPQLLPTHNLYPPRGDADENRGCCGWLPSRFITVVLIGIGSLAWWYFLS